MLLFAIGLQALAGKGGQMDAFHDDRRKVRRFEVKDSMFVSLRDDDRIGVVVEISLTGLSFEYFIERKDKEIDFFEVDIFSSRGWFHLYGIPCKVVYDFRLDKPSFIGLQTRRCGLKFEKLTEQQTESIVKLINSESGPFGLAA